MRSSMWFTIRDPARGRGGIGIALTMDSLGANVPFRADRGIKRRRAALRSARAGATRSNIGKRLRESTHLVQRHSPEFRDFSTHVRHDRVTQSEARGFPQSHLELRDRTN